jgi:hypothetical protein
VPWKSIFREFPLLKNDIFLKFEWYTKSYVLGALKAPKQANLLVPLILILASIKNFFHLSLKLYEMLWLI